MIDLDVLDTAVRLAAAGALAVIAVAMRASRLQGSLAWVGPIFFLSAMGHALFNCALLRDVGDHSEIGRAHV